MSLKITLKQWKQIEAAQNAIRQAIEAADTLTWAIYDQHHKTGTPPQGSEEEGMLLEINRRIHRLREEASMLCDVHPQSEWMGGASDNPKNHKLREPNCAPMPRRYFTPEEMAEVQAECHGPVQWTFGDTDKGTRKEG
jgi:hypothetical protein